VTAVNHRHSGRDPQRRPATTPTTPRDDDAAREPDSRPQPDDRALDEIARHFRALGEPLRLKLPSRLRESECNVGELTERLGCSQANVSKHLATLQAAGIVERRAVGTASYFRIGDPATIALCELVCDQVARRLGESTEVGRSVRDWAAENHAEATAADRGVREPPDRPAGIGRAARPTPEAPRPAGRPAMMAAVPKRRRSTP
jgi:DNA-binding transcriptional ArsR family regulator